MTQRIIEKIFLHLNHSKKKGPVVKNDLQKMCTSGGTFILTDWTSKHLLQSELQVFIWLFQLYSDEAQQ